MKCVFDAIRLTLQWLPHISLIFPLLVFIKSQHCHGHHWSLLNRCSRLLYFRNLYVTIRKYSTHFIFCLAKTSCLNEWRLVDKSWFFSSYIKHTKTHMHKATDLLFWGAHLFPVGYGFLCFRGAKWAENGETLVYIEKQLSKWSKWEKEE